MQDASYNAIQNAEKDLAANNTKKENAEKLLEESKDVVCLWLDKEVNNLSIETILLFRPARC